MVDILRRALGWLSGEAAALPSAAPEVYRLFLLSPEVVFRAQINASTFSYPLSEVAYDSVSIGSFGAIDVGATVTFGSAPGLRDLGSQRIRTLADATKIYFGRSSQGIRPGEVNLSDNIYVDVLSLFEVWSRAPFIEIVGDTAIIRKDPGLDVEWRTTTPPPVCNIGCGFAATIDDDSEITVALDASGSYATADGASISTYAWSIADGTVVTGDVDEDDLTATFPAGFRYVKCTVTDDEGHSASMRIPIFARDPENDLCIPFEFTSHRITPDGQSIQVRPLIDVLASDYPPGTLAMIWRREPADLFDRSHMVTPSSWLGDVPASAEASSTATLRDAELTLLDVAGRLNTIHAFSQRVEDDSLRDTTAFPAITWMHVVDLNIDKYIHYLLAWHSSALALADFYWSGTGDDYAATGLESDGQSFWDQCASRVRQMVPTWHLTCNRRGQLYMRPDPMLLDPADRTPTVQAPLTPADWSDLRYTNRRHPRAHWLHRGAIRSGRTLPLGTVFALAPGDAPGQGESEQTNNEGLVISQAALNAATGHEYARINAFQSEFRLTLNSSNDLGIEPADMAWVTLTTPAGRRGLILTEERMLPLEVSNRYAHAREGLTKTVELTLERETSGTPAVTYIPPAGDVPGDGDTWPGDYYGDPPPPPAPDVPPEPFSGDPQAYLLWDGVHVYRTMDILDVSPTWEFVDTGITGNIYDCQYVLVDADTVGIWLLASTGVWFCADILDATPSWTNVLPIATIQAADATPVSGTVEVKCMANYATAPGYLIVATGPRSTDAQNLDYAETNFWHTHDYGVGWTRVDAGLTNTAGGHVRGYFHSSLFAMEMFRSAPGTIYAQRSTPTYVLNTARKILLSTDLGHTWALSAYSPLTGLNNRQVYSTLHPFPSASDAAYIVSGPTGASDQPDLQRSADEWASGVQLTDNGTPTGYGGMSSLWRVNKISDDPDHVLGWFRHTANAEWHLLESNDQGVTWSLLYDSNLPTATIPNVPGGNTVSACPFNTPNGWPVTPGDTWFLVRATGTATAGRIFVTQDRFATAPVDKAGDLATLLGGASNMTAGPCGGIGLPKVGVNA